ncbi:hypothetical protein ACNJX9_36500 [Bradyrhizobium sp. DASA03076]|uniref:hypothetical protein n=1 Tax=Bradyrhizobium sp. BLXBL-03 TaxID=3395916 RepID=UPI003F702550
MKRDNVLQFPAPGHDLSSDAFVSELTRLCDELASELSYGAESGGFGDQLMRIEKSSILLASISQLVSRGRDRLRAAQSFERIMHAVAELRSEFEGCVSQDLVATSRTPPPSPSVS